MIKAAKADKQAADAEAIEAEAAEGTEATTASDPAEPPVDVEKAVEETAAAPVPVAKAAPRSAPRLRSLRIENEAAKPAPEPVEAPAQPIASEPVEAPAAPTQEPIPEPPAKTEDKPAMVAAPPETTPAPPAPPSPPAPAPVAIKRAGRFVPPTLRLRVEETKPRLRTPVVTRVIQLPTRTRP